MAFQHLKEAYKKDGHRLFVGTVVNRTKVNGFKLKDDRLDIGEKFFWDENSERLKQVAQTDGTCLIPKNF